MKTPPPISKKSRKFIGDRTGHLPIRDMPPVVSMIVGGSLLVLGLVSTVWGLALPIYIPKIIRGWRMAAGHGRRITLFRPFRAQESVFLRTTLAPTLGAYGDLSFLTNESFEEATPWTPLVTLSVFGGDDDISPDEFGGYENAPWETDAEWRAQAERFAANAEVIIIDVSNFNPNIQEELRLAMAHVEPHRLLLIANVREHPLSDVLSSLRGQVSPQAQDAPEIPLYYGSGPVTWLLFRVRLFQWFRALARLNRGS